MSEGMKTQRKDRVGRTSLDQALFEVDNLETAIILYDSTQALSGWAEKYFQTKGAAGFEEIKEVVRKTPKTNVSNLTRPIFDKSGAVVYALPKRLCNQSSQSQTTIQKKPK